MTEFSRKELRDLVVQENGPFVTLTMPIVGMGSDRRQNIIRLKNLLREAEQMLTALHRTDASTILEPAQDLLDDEDLFARSGLVMFLSTDPDGFRYYQVDIPLEAKVVVSERFYIRPLLPLLTNNEAFYVLSLSQNQVRLLKGSRQGLHRVDIPELPENMDEALQLQSEGRNAGAGPVRASARTNAPGRRTEIGSEGASFAGHGAGEEDNKQAIEHYCHLIDHAIHDTLKDETIPLVLVAVDYLHPLYRAVNTYPYLMDEGIGGHPAAYDAQTIIERVYAIIDPLLKQKQTAAAEHYQERIHKKQTSNSPVDILKAAHRGQVDTLFVQSDVALWGTYNLDNDRLEAHREQHAGDADLLDLAATQTILNDGTVYSVPSNEMPDDAPIAAVYRYTR